MKRFIKVTLLTGITAALLTSTANIMAQQGQGGGGRGNFDPAQFQQMMQDRYKEALGVTNEDEWKILWERIQKVQEAQRAIPRGGFGPMMGRRGGQGGGPGGQDANTQRRGGGGMFGGTPNPAVEELQTALDNNASTEVIKAKLNALRESRKAAEAKLEKAQEDLKKVLTQKQEARLVLMGLLK